MGRKNGVIDDTLLNGVNVQYSDMNETLTVTGLNLGKGEKVFIRYRVQLVEQEFGFTYDAWYNTNERSTLLPKMHGKLLDFPIPKASKVFQEEDENDSNASNKNQSKKKEVV